MQAAEMGVGSLITQLHINLKGMTYYKGNLPLALQKMRNVYQYDKNDDPNAAPVWWDHGCISDTIRTKPSHVIYESTKNFSLPKKTLHLFFSFAFCVLYDTEKFFQDVNYFG